MKSLRSKILLASAICTFSMGAAIAQKPMADKMDPSTEQALERAEILRADIATNIVDVTPEQWKKVEALNEETMNQINNIAPRYKENDKVYENRVRIILQQRDARLSEILDLRQFAIYMNGSKDDLAYNSVYKSDDLKIKTKESGKIKVKTDEGKIKIKDDEVKVKNELRNTEWEYTADEIKYEDEDSNVKLEVEDDQVVEKTREKKLKVKEDEARLKKDDEKIEVENEDDEESSK